MIDRHLNEDRCAVHMGDHIRVAGCVPRAASLQNFQPLASGRVVYLVFLAHSLQNPL